MRLPPFKAKTSVSRRTSCTAKKGKFSQNLGLHYRVTHTMKRTSAPWGQQGRYHWSKRSETQRAHARHALGSLATCCLLTYPTQAGTVLRCASVHDNLHPQSALSLQSTSTRRDWIIRAARCLRSSATLLGSEAAVLLKSPFVVVFLYIERPFYTKH